jgi:hypothetical protein
MHHICLLLITLCSFSGYSQEFGLSVNRSDELNNDTVNTPYQSISHGRDRYINLNFSRKSGHYYIGYQSQFKSKSRNLQNTFINKDAKAYFKLKNDSVIVVSYKGEKLSPLVSYNAAKDNWLCKLEFDIEISAVQLEKLSRLPVEKVTFENLEDKWSVKLRGASRRLYFVHYIPLLK